MNKAINKEKENGQKLKEIQDKHENTVKEWDAKLTKNIMKMKHTKESEMRLLRQTQVKEKELLIQNNEKVVAEEIKMIQNTHQVRLQEVHDMHDEEMQELENEYKIREQHVREEKEKMLRESYNAITMLIDENKRQLSKNSTSEIEDNRKDVVNMNIDIDVNENLDVEEEEEMLEESQNNIIQHYSTLHKNGKRRRIENSMYEQLSDENDFSMNT